jgi:hypothetical protein
MLLYVYIACVVVLQRLFAWCGICFISLSFAIFWLSGLQTYILVCCYKIIYEEMATQKY